MVSGLFSRKRSFKLLEKLSGDRRESAVASTGRCNIYTLSTGEGDVENEAATQDLLQLRTKKLDVGSLAERRFDACYRWSF